MLLGILDDFCTNPLTDFFTIQKLQMHLQLLRADVHDDTDLVIISSYRRQRSWTISTLSTCIKSFAGAVQYRSKNSPLRWSAWLKTSNQNSPRFQPRAFVHKDHQTKRLFGRARLKLQVELARELQDPLVVKALVCESFDNCEIVDLLNGGLGTFEVRTSLRLVGEHVSAQFG